MESKVFDLLEKMYIEFTDFRKEVNGRFEGLEGSVGRLEGRMDNLESRMGKLEGRMDNIEGRMSNLEINQETLSDKIDEVFEAISAHAEINERQHQEILKELKGEISVIELAVKRNAK